MDLNFLVPSASVPVGGVLSIYRFAQAMLEHGHAVRIVHVDLHGKPSARIEEFAHLIQLDPRITNEYIDDFDGDLSGGDAVFCFDERIPTMAGLPLMWIQAVLAHQVFGVRGEAAIFSAPCPKLCTSSWLRFVAQRWGNPAEQLELVPYGLDFDCFRPKIPLSERGPRVSMLWHAAQVKGGWFGLKAIKRAKKRIPELRATLFGTAAPPDDLPDWISYRFNPPLQEIVDDIYNGHSAFVLPSLVEGFGITGIEAQACGTPLVVTANGGSGDYATHRVSALVSAPGHISSMEFEIVRALSNRQLAATVAKGGLEASSQFTWQKSGKIIDDLLKRYAADPEFYQRPVQLSSNLEKSWKDMHPMLKEFHAQCGTGIPWCKRD